MLYRRFPKISNVEVSILGFGCMRLPTVNNEYSKIDQEITEKLFQCAYEQGINYYDTAYVYHGGNSESSLGTAINKLQIRDKIYIADKCPVWLVNSETDWEKYIDEQLARLQTDYIDFYLLHALNKESWQKVKHLKGLQALEKAQKSGKIRYIGFSFHDSLETFKTIVDEYSGWQFAQIQFNYIDTDYQAGLEGLKYAEAHQLGVISMEPLRGGLLANPPADIVSIFSQADKPRVPAEWALRYVWEHQNIVCALSGMNSIEQVMINCASASTGRPNSLPVKQLDIINKAASWFKSQMKTPCTACKYCNPCPSGVSINDVLTEYNAMSMKGLLGQVSAQYANILKEERGADKCVSCGICIDKCPQHISIPEKLSEAHKILLGNF